MSARNVPSEGNPEIPANYEPSFWRYGWRIWVLGVKMMVRMALFSLGLAIMWQAALMIGHVVYLLTGTALGGESLEWVKSACGAAALIVSAPLAFYVAGSWVGFCPRILSASDV